MATKYEQIVDRLVKRTEDKKVEWKESSVTGVYQVSFPNYSLTISEELPRGQDIPDYVLSVINSESMMVDSFSDVVLDKDRGEQKYFKILQGLYQNARRQALGVDSALDEILNELDDTT